MKFSEYTAHDVVGLAALIRRREVSPLEVVNAAIEGIERYDREINAVVYRAFDEARAAAVGPLPEGPFTGVPFLVKDLLLQVRGWSRTSGSRYAANAGFTDTQDSGLMRRYRASGVVTMGKTNLSEFGIAGTTEGALFGPCRNPWDLGHIVGGSSGGSRSDPATQGSGITRRSSILSPRSTYGARRSVERCRPTGRDPEGDRSLS